MRENVKLNNLPDIGSIAGYVRIDYKDPITGKTKERIDSKNLVFTDQFDSTAWYNILNSTAIETLFITDDNTPPNKGFQYLRGNIIGWGRIGGDASGIYRGGYNTLESYVARYFASEMKMKWQYVYDFTPAQIPEEIGSLGITMQYGNFATQNLPVYPTKRFPYVIEANHYVYKNQTGYMINSAGIVTVYNPLENSKRTVDISSVTGTAATLCIGLHADDDRVYVMAYSSTAANRRVYEFADDFFGTPIRTLSPTNITSYPSTSRVFVVLGNFYYYYSTGWWRGDFVNNVNATLQTMPGCPYNTSIMSGNNGSIILKDGLAYNFYDFYSTSGNRAPIWDLMANKQVGTISACNRNPSTSYHQQCVLNPTSTNKPILISNYSGLLFYYRNALTCFAIDGNQPARPANSSVQIRYLIEVEY
ncbi:MAG: hypothetical protein FWE90_14130 [Defluviitaleaceae bacterium]|nr:hypothetical protein [Defluviitaleaceae bacterium]